MKYGVPLSCRRHLLKSSDQLGDHPLESIRFDISEVACYTAQRSLTQALHLDKNQADRCIGPDQPKALYWHDVGEAAMMVNRSISRLTNVFLALFLLLSGGVVYWQVFQSRTLSTSTYNPRRCDVGNQPVRGSIYDRNGVLLAYSEYDPNVPCNYRRYYCFPSLSPIIGYFSYVYGETGLEEAFDDYLTGQKGAGTSSINNFWDQTLHRPVYGSDIYLTIDWRVQNLIDKQFDITYDEPGGVLGNPLFRLARGTVGPDPNNPRPSRCDQNLVKTMYNQPAEGAPHWHPGSVIVEDPHTGEILGMLSRPYFDANKIGDYTTCRQYINDTKYAKYPPCPGAQQTLPAGLNDKNQELGAIGPAYFQQLTHDQFSPLLTRPTNGVYPPGSTFKTVTLAAALDTGKYHLNDPFGGNNCLAADSEARRYTVNGHTFQDIDLLTYNPPPACPIDLEHGYIYSDNIIFARVGVGVGADTWLNYAQRFGISDSKNKRAIPFDLPLTPSTAGFQGIQDDRVNLAAAAFGQGTLLVTPMTMTFVTSAVANDGVAMQPHLLYKVVPHGVNPNDVAPISPTQYGNGPLMSKTTAQNIQASMRGVVKQGSAGLISATRANVGGKTGTAQLENADPHSWFISLAPDNPGQTPKWVVVVMREHGDEGLLQAPVADCIYLNMPGQAPLPNVNDGNFYPRYHCAP